MLRAIDRCRVCGDARLVPLIDLGDQALTGIFPRREDPTVATAPLELVKCMGEGACGLIQLRHTYDLHALYGRHYGYRSSLNRSMVRHLEAKVQRLLRTVTLRQGDLVLDIGSNDGTLLKSYPRIEGLTLVGIDPTSLTEYYPSHIELIPDFFSVEAVRARHGERRAKVITSVAMFYDLEAPLEFARSVASLLADDGVWHLEQSYTPTMLEKTAYDTICHEHLEYYCMSQLRWIMERAELKVIDVDLNDVNGGSFAITVARRAAPYPEATAQVQRLLDLERAAELDAIAPYERFKARVEQHREELPAALADLRRKGKLTLGYGASTKGNVVLQYCGLGPDELPAIAEVNADKFGCVTPGSRIPIIPEAEARARRPDVFMVMPWHFRRGIVERELEFLRAGGRLLMPLPEIELLGTNEAAALLELGAR
jgi:NDP-4-keto-2,6-dideoxyhexose 3-C-methyltransferase